MKRATDHHSYAKPSEAVTTHLSWDAEVDFDTRQIHATATYQHSTWPTTQNVCCWIVEGLDIHSVKVDGQEVDLSWDQSVPSLDNR